MQRKEKINLNKKIYPRQKVLETIEAYERYCKMNLSENEKYLSIEINYDDKYYLPGEISNYLVSLLKE